MPDLDSLSRDDLIRLILELQRQIEDLRKQNVELRRKDKRSAAPFSKGERKKNPKRPGRKPSVQQPPLPGLAADQPAPKPQRRTARAVLRQGAIPKPNVDKLTGVLWATPKRPGVIPPSTTTRTAA